MSFNVTTTQKVGPVIISILQVRKLRHKKINNLPAVTQRVSRKTEIWTWLLSPGYAMLLLLYLYSLLLNPHKTLWCGRYYPHVINEQQSLIHLLKLYRKRQREFKSGIFVSKVFQYTLTMPVRRPGSSWPLCGLGTVHMHWPGDVWLTWVLTPVLRPVRWVDSLSMLGVKMKDLSFIIINHYLLMISFMLEFSSVFAKRLLCA